MLDQFKISKETLDRHAQYTYGYDEESEVESSSSVSSEEEYNYESIEDVNERTLIESIDSDIYSYKTGNIDVGWLTFWLKHRIEEYEKAVDEAEEENKSVQAEPVTAEPMPLNKEPPSNTEIALITIGAVALLCFIFK